ncbi:fucose 4-O-acetylase-like acetyltransferase [Nocardiopsis arvandica]|uniref:Fucose 4-O-acetylase-like acetyltransferase n=1 Tax=Nocardiopsis sinuspersici TaxID=501010 RepID=A0A7Z0BK25_9ACTN|nr:acyltransferase family protein [Nocardiopsis sinuspersici]NYH53731.1 fucose 4-O-acetylase-like acetyltransferase [Nocardiopsis sinuspersici]
MTSPADRSPEPGQGATAPATDKKTGAAFPVPGRDARLDNAKFILIALVVVGHAIEPLRDYGPAKTLYYWIYFFHMPAFILISGYLSRSFDASSKRVEKLVLTLAVPYLIFWTIHQGINFVERGGLPDSLSVLKPTWTLWFLIALFLWRLSVPIWNRLRWPVLIAVAISVFGATTSLGATLSLGRVVSLLPFFVLGLSLRREHFAYLDKLWVRIASLVVLGTVAVLAVPISRDLSTEWLFWKDSLTDRDIDPLMPSVGLWLAFMILALVMTFAVLALTPKQHTWFTSLGAYTLYVYLGHSVVLIVLKATPLYDVMSGLTGLITMLVLSPVLLLLLCTPWVRASMRWAVEPQLTWFLREDSVLREAKEAGGAPGGGRSGTGSGERERAGV